MKISTACPVVVSTVATSGGEKEKGGYSESAYMMVRTIVSCDESKIGACIISGVREGVDERGGGGPVGAL